MPRPVRVMVESFWRICSWSIRLIHRSIDWRRSAIGLVPAAAGPASESKVGGRTCFRHHDERTVSCPRVYLYLVMSTICTASQIRTAHDRKRVSKRDTAVTNFFQTFHLRCISRLLLLPTNQHLPDRPTIDFMTSAPTIFTSQGMTHTANFFPLSQSDNNTDRAKRLPTSKVPEKNHSCSRHREDHRATRLTCILFRRLPFRSPLESKRELKAALDG
nr:hypothetical protein CFP56_24578 [Quercus suber]